MQEKMKFEPDRLDDLIMDLLMPDDQPMLTDEEVSALIAQHNTKTGKEFVDSIYAMLGMERPVE